MIVINNNASLTDFNAWSGAKETKERIIKGGKTEQFNQFIDEVYPDGLTQTELNDLLWFEDEYIYNILNIDNEQ